MVDALVKELGLKNNFTLVSSVGVKPSNGAVEKN